MHKTLILAAGLALVGTSAWSQSLSDDRDDYYRGDRHEYSGRWDRGDSRWERQDTGEWDRDRGGRRDRAMRDDQEGRPGSGARFFLRSGDTLLRVVCGDQESTRACVDAALAMFDRVQSQARSGTGSSAPGSSGPGSSAPPSQP